MNEVVGIRRERRFSPGKVADDAAILEAAAMRLRTHGVVVEVIDPDHDRPPDRPLGLVFTMCQSAEWLARLEGLRCPVVNSPAAIRNCHRTNLVERLAAAGVAQPRWRLAGASLPRDLGPGPWLKRGDVHAMEADDVRRVFDESDWAAATADFERRGIRQAIVQEHHEGDVFKFYGVTGGFFCAYGLPPERRDAAARLAAAGARALGLEVYGGDGVCGPDGSLALVDFNDWPSFSRCREDAAAAIAARVLEILESQPTDDGRPQ